MPLPFAETLATELRDYPEWHRGRLRYAVWVVPVHCPRLQAHVARMRAALADLLHPTRRQAHVTLFVCGFEQALARHDDDFTPAQLAAQWQALRACAPAAGRLRIGAVDSFASAAFLRVEDPDGLLGPLRAALGSAAREVRQSPYVPHLTLGLYRHTVTAPHLAERLACLPEAGPALPLEELRYVSYAAGDQFGRLRTRRRFRRRRE